MHIKFIDDVFPNNYSTYTPISNLEEIKIREGKKYTLLGQSEKTYLFGQRVWHGIRALAKTVLTLGVGLLFEKTRSDWKFFFAGKKVVVIYSSCRFLATKILAKRGHAQAQNDLGSMYERGQGVEKSYEKAVSYYHLAANQDNAQAQNHLGLMYMIGLGVKQSYEKAAKYYLLAVDRLAADQGSDGVQYNLGLIYENGLGVEKSYEKAVSYYCLAAGQGHAQAQNNLGSMYVRGLGVKRSYEEAVRYFRLAAAQGDAKAQNNLEYLLNE